MSVSANTALRALVYCRAVSAPRQPFPGAIAAPYSHSTLCNIMAEIHTCQSVLTQHCVHWYTTGLSQLHVNHFQALSQHLIERYGCNMFWWQQIPSLAICFRIIPHICNLDPSINLSIHLSTHPPLQSSNLPSLHMSTERLSLQLSAFLFVCWSHVVSIHVPSP